jgi:hypothetical protein
VQLLSLAKPKAAGYSWSIPTLAKKGSVMWSDTHEGRQFIEEISRNVVTEVAADELELFPEMARDYFENPRPTGGRRSKDDALAFGLETVTVLTPVVLAVASAVVRHVVEQVNAQELVQVAKTETSDLIKAKIKAVFAALKESKTDPSPPVETHEKPAAPVPVEKAASRSAAKVEGTNRTDEAAASPLDRKQLIRIKRLAIERATAEGMKAAEAERIALSLIGSLALAK